MTNNLISMRVTDKKLSEILSMMEESRQTIHNCYVELGALGCVELDGERIALKISEYKAEEILDKLEIARETIHCCINDLMDMGYVQPDK